MSQFILNRPPGATEYRNEALGIGTFLLDLIIKSIKIHLENVYNNVYLLFSCSLAKQ